MGDNRQDLQSLSLVPSELMYQFSSPVSSTNERPEDHEHEKVTKSSSAEQPPLWLVPYHSGFWLPPPQSAPCHSSQKYSANRKKLLIADDDRHKCEHNP